MPKCSCIYVVVTLETKNGEKIKEKRLLAQCPLCGMKFEDMH